VVPILDASTQTDDYVLFCTVQSLLEKRRLDDLMLQHGEVSAVMLDCYGPLAPWLREEDLGRHREREPDERYRRYWRAIQRAHRGEAGDYREDWMTDELRKEGFTWRDAEMGRHPCRDIDLGDLNDNPIAEEATQLRVAPHAMTERGPRETGPLYSFDLQGIAADDAFCYEKALHENNKYHKLSQCVPACILATMEDIRRRYFYGLGSFEVKGAGTYEMDIVDSEGEGSAIREAYNENWLVDRLRATGDDTAEDLQTHMYKGWLMPAPRVCLIRICNFLSAEDIDCTIGWREKIAEIDEYLVQLSSDYDKAPANGKPSWSFELREAIEALKVHETFEKYYYGKRDLVLDFDASGKKESGRLRTRKGVGLEMHRGKMFDSDLYAPRQLVHREHQAFISDRYKIPSRLLKAFLEELWSDECLLWETPKRTIEPTNTQPLVSDAFHRVIPNKRIAYNLADVEDKAFISNIRRGPHVTAANLSGNHSFTLNPTVIHHDSTFDGQHEEQLFRFAQFRGATRAGLMSALRFIGGMQKELAAVESPWRRVALPPKALRRKHADGFPGLVYKPDHRVENPEPHDLDPMAYLFWHGKLLEIEQDVATRTAGEVSELERKSRAGRDQERHVTVPTKNARGPFIPSMVNCEREMDEDLVKALEKIHRRLKTTHRMAPREATEQCLDLIDRATRGERSILFDNAFPPDAFDDCKGEPLGMDLDSPDLAFLELLAEGSFNRDMLTPLPPEWDPEKLLFADRLQALLDNISPTSIFRDPGVEVSEDEIYKAINGNISGTLQGLWFSKQDTISILAELGLKNRILVLSRTDSKQRVTYTYSRPTADLHPEHRLKWHTPGLAPHSRPVLMAYAELEALTHTALDRQYVRTLQYLKGTAFRLGKTLREIRAKLQLASPLTEAQATFFQRASRAGRISWERLVERDCQDDRRTAMMSLKDLIKRADPESYQAQWGHDDNPVEEDEFRRMVEIVNTALVREASLARTMLWPARECWATQHDGTKVNVGRRDASVWSWAKPSVRGSHVSRFFSLDRWPVNLQSETTRKDIEASSGVPTRITYEDPPAPPRPKSPKLIPIWDPEVSKFRHRHGVQRFWHGDTPAQKRWVIAGFENMARQRKPPTYLRPSSQIYSIYYVFADKNTKKPELGLPLQKMPDPQQPDPFRLVYHEDVLGKPRPPPPPSPPSPKRPAPPSMATRLWHKAFPPRPEPLPSGTLERLFRRDPDADRAREEHHAKRMRKRGPEWIEKALREVESERRAWERRCGVVVVAVDEEGEDVEMGGLEEDGDLGDHQPQVPPAASGTDRGAPAEDSRLVGPDQDATGSAHGPDTASNAAND